MATTYVTSEGDALDLVCHREYGAQAGVVEQVLEANPHIKDIAHRMPLGITITLPDISVTQSTGQAVRLWD